LPLLVALIVLALVFDFLNGLHDSSNIVATIISSRALPPRWALIGTAIAEFVGPFLFGVAVAKTIGSEIVPPHTITTSVVFAALLSAIVWDALTWYLGIPCSSSHALVGGILGAVAVFACPIPGTAAYAWLPAALDPGSGYALGSLVVNLCRQKWGRQ